MNKNRIRLTESQLHKVIKESVKKILKESVNTGKFPKLMRDPNTPNSSRGLKNLYDKVSELNQRKWEIESKIEQLENDIEQLEASDWQNFKDYAQDKYSISDKNMEKNWGDFSDSYHYKHSHDNYSGNETNHDFSGYNSFA